MVSLQPGDYSKVNKIQIFQKIFVIKILNYLCLSGHPPSWLSPCKHECHVGWDEWTSQVVSSLIILIIIKRCTMNCSSFWLSRAEYKQFFLAYHARFNDMMIKTIVHTYHDDIWYILVMESPNYYQGFPIRLHWPSFETPLGSTRWPMIWELEWQQTIIWFFQPLCFEVDDAVDNDDDYCFNDNHLILFFSSLTVTRVRGSSIGCCAWTLLSAHANHGN